MSKHTAAITKANANRTAQPGVIGSICDLLTAARDNNSPCEYSKLLIDLHKLHSDRAITGLAITLRAQLSRLPKQRGFGIDKFKYDGYRETYYAAAPDKQTKKRRAA